ncbi:hypothetical protein CHS0354_033806 [Potamilus streckersoni]|uniref:Uncharacterized protein n=1 Tax=Potamilus streckersoni TaxID=2493646 RepID=A0AAE0VU79_9BIVA|nr:hypothetical protein CHS0354_033806 [Potamilus streckersoni]
METKAGGETPKLVYILAGMGCILVAGGCILCLRKFRKLASIILIALRMSIPKTSEDLR